MTVLESGQSATAAGLALPHHDGSDLYVLERPDEPGGEATVRVRVPASGGVERVFLRYVGDGEPRAVAAERDEETGAETWWRASFPVTKQRGHYRWLLDGEDGYTWVTGAGLLANDVGDAGDFILPLDRGGPEWHLGSVVYEIFPDRFARAGAASFADQPEWAVARPWDALPEGRGRTTPREWFGGDLPGIEQHLEHVTRLGANVIYMTPIFPAGSTHRYDATSFDVVDPLLGGDDAFDSLVTAARAKGLRLIGDLTLNHCGSGHEWFRDGRAYPHAPEHDFFYWDDEAYAPLHYAAWFGVSSLPKLNWADAELRRRMLGVVDRWLSRGLDGWRIDVANMVARHGAYDANHEVARLTREAAAAACEEPLVLAEHGHDYRPDLSGDGWHGAMNYAGFLRPVWMWLRRPDLPERVELAFGDLPVPFALRSGRDTVEAMQVFRSAVPWQSVAHSWTLLDSHDVARFRTVAGSRERQLVGVGLQMTTPGVPMIFAGDEIGLEGEWGEDARRTMPWDAIDTWDGPLFEEYSALVALRRASDALARGGIRYVHVSDDAIAYLRESRSERLLCLAARAQHDPIVVPFGQLETLYGGDASDGVLPADGPAFHVWRIHG
jgi:alpha-glucosidase